jgi:hypothetical protein
VFSWCVYEEVDAFRGVASGKTIVGSHKYSTSLFAPHERYRRKAHYLTLDCEVSVLKKRATRLLLLLHVRLCQ